MSSLSKVQEEAVASWFAAGASLDEIQKRLRAEFDVHMTYLDLRLLVAELPQPVEAEREPPRAPKPAPAPVEPPSAPDEPLPAGDGPRATSEPPTAGPHRSDLDAPDAAPDASQPDVVVELDALMIPGTIASGDVTFSDGKKGKWYVDQQGRLGLGNLPEGYRPSPTDASLFQTRLMELLRSRGMC